MGFLTPGEFLFFRFSLSKESKRRFLFRDRLQSRQLLLKLIDRFWKARFIQSS